MAERTPLFDWHVAHGAHMVDFAGWDMPVRYGTITEEHQAVRTAVGLFDISHMGRLVFTGPGAADFLQCLYTNDVPSMKQGQARYGLVCNERGGILDDVLVYRFATSWMMVVNASNRLKILSWIERKRERFDVHVKDRTKDWAMVAIQGPKSIELMSAAGYDLRRLKYYFAEEFTNQASPRIHSRTGYTGEDGCEVILPATEVVSYCDQLLQLAQQGGLGLKLCGLGARDTLRLEAAMPLYGHELNEDIDPLQADLGWAVKLEKTELIGREALLDRQADTGRPIRVGLELEGKRIAREGASVLRSGVEVGKVTSGTFAPTLNKAIAMAYVAPVHAEPGTLLEVDVRGKPASARVVPLPFYRRTKK